MTINEKLIIYKILDFVKLYNLGVKFVFIRYHMKSCEFFLVRPLVEADHAITGP